MDETGQPPKMRAYFKAIQQIDINDAHVLPRPIFKMHIELSRAHAAELRNNKLTLTKQDSTSQELWVVSAAFGDNSTLGVSRVIFINGDNDPFSWGSVTVNSTAALERDVVALVARAGSHCADMGASSDYDTPSMAAVKQAKAAYFAKWATEPEGGF